MKILDIPIGEDSSVYMTGYIQEKRKEEEKKRRVLVLCPGGFYIYHSPREGEAVALAYANRGYDVFILYYSVAKKGLFPRPMLDLAKAIAWIRKHADKLNIDEEKISLLGFSAGGHLVTAYSNMYKRNLFLEELKMDAKWIKPNAILAAYPPIDTMEYEPLTQEELDQEIEIDFQDKKQFREKPLMPLAFYKLIFGDTLVSVETLKFYSPIYNITQDTPPTFLWITREDEKVDVKGVLRYALALQEKKKYYELHVFDKGMHGMSLANEKTQDDSRKPDEHIGKWLELSMEFLDRIYV